MLFEQPHRGSSLLDQRSLKPLALVVALVLCLFAFVLGSKEAWANEQSSSTEQQQPVGESITIVNGQQVAEPAPVPTSPPASATPPSEPTPTQTLPPPPSDTVAPKTDPEAAPQPSTPQPTPLQRTVVITSGGGETVGPGVEPVSTSGQPEPASKESSTLTTPSTTTTTTTPSESAPEPASAAPTPNNPGSAGAPAALPAAVSAAPAEVVEPLMEGLPALQEEEVAQGVASQEEEQARPGYSSFSEIAPASGSAAQPLTQALTDAVGTSTSEVAKAVAGLLGTVGQWVADAATTTSGEESSSSSSSGGTTPEPFIPVNPEPWGSSFVSLFSGMGQSSAGGAGASTLLLGVLLLASTLLLRRDLRMYLVSCEVAKPSSALLSPLERPG